MLDKTVSGESLDLKKESCDPEDLKVFLRLDLKKKDLYWFLQESREKPHLSTNRSYLSFCVPHLPHQINQWYLDKVEETIYYDYDDLRLLYKAGIVEGDRDLFDYTLNQIAKDLESLRIVDGSLVKVLIDKEDLPPVGILNFLIYNEGAFAD